MLKSHFSNRHNSTCVTLFRSSLCEHSAREPRPSILALRVDTLEYTFEAMLETVLGGTLENTLESEATFEAILAAILVAAL